MKRILKTSAFAALWLCLLGVFLTLAPAACGGGSSSSTAQPVADDDDNDDDNDDNDDASPDDDASPGDDDASPLPDDYVAPWPQSNVEPRDYDETVAAGPLRQKADAYDAWHREWHQPYYGGSLETIFTDATHTTVQSYDTWPDSCIWTGTYLGGEAMRYYVANDAATKANAIAMVQVLDGFLHVTGKKGFIARYRAPQTALMYPGDAACDADDFCHRVESGPYAGDFWWGQTSRDQYTGWFFGMLTAYDLIDDEPTRTTIRADVTEVIETLIAQHWWILEINGLPTNSGPNILPEDQLTWLLIAYHMTGLDEFKKPLQAWLADAARPTIRLLDLNITNRYATYYANNLGQTLFYCMLRLGKVYFSPNEYEYLVQLYETQQNTYARLSHNPWFTAIHMSQGDYQPQPPVDPYRTQLLDDLTDFFPPPNHSFHLAARTNYVLDPVSEILYELEQALPWLANIIGGVDEQALDAFPIPQQCSAQFLFQSNPFEIHDCGTDDAADVYPGVDYLVAYWLPSYHKIVSKDL